MANEPAQPKPEPSLRGNATTRLEWRDNAISAPEPEPSDAVALQRASLANPLPIRPFDTHHLHAEIKRLEAALAKAQAAVPAIVAEMQERIDHLQANLAAPPTPSDAIVRVVTHDDIDTSDGWRWVIGALKIRLESITLREAEIACGVSKSALSRITNGKPVSLDNFFAVRDWLAPPTPSDGLLRKALEKVRDKAGSHTVSLDAIKRGESDPGYAGIYNVANNALLAALAEQEANGDANG